MSNPFIIGEAVYLRSPEPGDEQIIAVSENHPDPRNHLFYAKPTSIAEHQQKLEKYKDDPDCIAFTICRKKDDKAIGITAFFRIDWIGRMTIFYIAIAKKEDWSKGYGKETTSMMVNYAFKTLNLNRIQLHVHTGNVRAVHIYEKAGFQVEGTLRKAMYFDNHYHDFYVMSILREEWERTIS